MKFRSEGATLFHADRRTDEQTNMIKLIVTFCNFWKAPKNIHDSQIYLRKYLKVISLPILTEYHYNRREHHIQWQFIQNIYVAEL